MINTEVVSICSLNEISSIDYLIYANYSDRLFYSRVSHSGIGYGRGRTNAFGVYIGHKICHRVPATSATLLSRPAITMSEGLKD